MLLRGARGECGFKLVAGTSDSHLSLAAAAVPDELGLEVDDEPVLEPEPVDAEDEAEVVDVVIPLDVEVEDPVDDALDKLELELELEDLLLDELLIDDRDQSCYVMRKRPGKTRLEVEEAPETLPDSEV